ncbi:hypothetical protein GCM10010435_75680 [Winogradskya consettensis]|uniref:RING-type domain-containing protein n=1 Tax=Winogradskya consettensis TaxID=113560 RepID=A0A919SZD0_9ACTN|nr:MXAN_6230/SCO0854 family RING domain-containing protein [Actinoplanes consettensis]GIM81217.1 hypothetical protein Aco04nite_75460 [Actinoplanes consettensis]
MDPLAVVLLRRTSRVAITAGTADGPADGGAWVAALEADLAGRGWLLRNDLRLAAARLPATVRVQWADWLLATVDELVGADRPMLPLYRSFPDTPRNPEAVYVRRLLTHLFAVPGAPCVLCGRPDEGAPLDPCGHLVCTGCFPPAEFSACPICGRRVAAESHYLPIEPQPQERPLLRRVLPRLPQGRSTTADDEALIDDDDARPRPVAPEAVRIIGLEPAPDRAATDLRDTIVGRPGALGEADRADLKVLVTATAPGDLGWLPEVVPARETLALLIAWALHASALTDDFPIVLAAARERWGTATDVARALWAYSGGDPGLVLPRGESSAFASGPAFDFALGEPPVTVPVVRVRALPRPLRRAVLAHLDSLGVAVAAENMRRHPTVWKRLGEKLHPHEKIVAHPRAAVAFAALRGTRTSPIGALGTAITEACAREPRHLIRTEHPGGTISVTLRTHASLVEQAFTGGDIEAATRLLTERPGDLWRRTDQLLRGGPSTHAAVLAALHKTAARVAPAVLTATSAELHNRNLTVRATPAQLASVTRARAAAQALRTGSGSVARPAATADTFGSLGAALRAAAERLGYHPETAAPPTPSTPTADGPAPHTDAALPDEQALPHGQALPDQPALPHEQGLPDQPALAAVMGMPRRIFFPSGGVVTTWTEPERRKPLPAEAIDAVRALVDTELTRRATRDGNERFDVAVIDAALAEVPAPMRERGASAQFAGWPRGSIRRLPTGNVLRLFLHWQDAGRNRVDLDLSCAFFDSEWRRIGHCDYTNLRFADDAAVHSGDLTSAPPPLGATEYLDLNLEQLTAKGAQFAVPVVLSFNAVPFEALGEAFAGLMLPLPRGRQFDGARVAQRFDLQGNARMLMPMVVDLTDRRLLWTDLTLNGIGYGHSVGRHGDQLGRAAADQWDHFLGGHRTTLLDLTSWHAAAGAGRVLVVHRDETCSEVAPEASAIRAAAAAATGPLPGLPDLTGLRVLAGTSDAADLHRLIPHRPGPGSMALTVTGTPGEAWTAVGAGDLLARLLP